MDTDVASATDALTAPPPPASLYPAMPEPSMPPVARAGVKRSREASSNASEVSVPRVERGPVEDSEPPPLANVAALTPDSGNDDTVRELLQTCCARVVAASQTCTRFNMAVDGALATQHVAELLLHTYDRDASTPRDVISAAYIPLLHGGPLLHADDVPDAADVAPQEMDALLDDGQYPLFPRITHALHALLACVLDALVKLAAVKDASYAAALARILLQLRFMLPHSTRGVPPLVVSSGDELLRAHAARDKVLGTVSSWSVLIRAFQRTTRTLDDAAAQLKSHLEALDAGADRATAALQTNARAKAEVDASIQVIMSRSRPSNSSGLMLTAALDLISSPDPALKSLMESRRALVEAAEALQASLVKFKAAGDATASLLTVVEVLSPNLLEALLFAYRFNFRVDLTRVVADLDASSAALLASTCSGIVALDARAVQVHDLLQETAGVKSATYAWSKSAPVSSQLLNEHDAALQETLDGIHRDRRKVHDDLDDWFKSAAALPLECRKTLMRRMGAYLNPVPPTSTDASAAHIHTPACDPTFLPEALDAALQHVQRHSTLWQNVEAVKRGGTVTAAATSEATSLSLQVVATCNASLRQHAEEYLAPVCALPAPVVIESLAALIRTHMPTLARVSDAVAGEDDPTWRSLADFGAIFGVDDEPDVMSYNIHVLKAARTRHGTDDGSRGRKRRREEAADDEDGRRLVERPDVSGTLEDDGVTVVEDDDEGAAESSGDGSGGCTIV